jgi:hypothetical protein
MGSKYRIVREGSLYYPEYKVNSWFWFKPYWKRFKEDSFLYNGIFSSYDEVDVYFSDKKQAINYIEEYKDNLKKEIINL